MIAAFSPANCFYMAIEAARIALKYMTPVVLLTDGYLANGSEPWLLPKAEDLPDISIPMATDPETYQPYARDENLSRPWAVPGTAGLEHRIGGLEKKHITGHVNYEPSNHQFMCEMRAKKTEKVQDDIPNQDVFGPATGDLAIVGWGGTYGALRAATERLQGEGHSVAHVHIKYLNPFPKNLKDVLGNYKTILVPELNLGQLAYILRANFLIDPISLAKVQGLPFTPSEIYDKARSILAPQS